MIQAEYVRSLNCNYERILLEKKPEEKRYQYCILNRGGIKGLLPCGLRYINGVAYLYYDISSKQNVAQMYSSRSINREWVRDFLWSMREMQQELERFLLDAGNVLLFPDQIFQDLESKVFYFLYIPYYGEESGFGKMMEFLVEHIDYEDELLVDCVYHMYEQLERSGEAYLQEKIFEDAKRLEMDSRKQAQQVLEQEGLVEVHSSEKVYFQDQAFAGENYGSSLDKEEKSRTEVKPMEIRKVDDRMESGKTDTAEKENKRGIFSMFEGKKHRNKRMREEYKLSMQQAMAGYAVAEETNYEAEEYGRTIYMEEKEGGEDRIHRLYTVDGQLLATLERADLTIGKKKEEVDLPLEDASVSRMHAKIMLDKGQAYLEDLNSTNGTFKNGLRLQPYEKRKLDAGDEIKCGKAIMMFR